MKSIDENRKEVEHRLKRPVVIYSAFPAIGRGFIRHDTITHEEVERTYERAERGVFRYYVYRLKQTLRKRHA